MSPIRRKLLLLVRLLQSLLIMAGRSRVVVPRPQVVTARRQDVAARRRDVAGRCRTSRSIAFTMSDDLLPHLFAAGRQGKLALDCARTPDQCKASSADGTQGKLPLHFDRVPNQEKHGASN